MIKIVLIVMGITMNGETHVLQRVDEPDIETCSRHIYQKQFTEFPPKGYFTLGYSCIEEREV